MSSFLFTPGYPKSLTGKKKKIHGKNIEIHYCYFIKQISFVTLGTLLNFLALSFLFYKSDMMEKINLSHQVMATKKIPENLSTTRLYSICKGFIV